MVLTSLASLEKIHLLWKSREALLAMRQIGGTPAGILMFRSAGAEPEFSVFDVVDVIGATPR